MRTTQNLNDMDEYHGLNFCAINHIAKANIRVYNNFLRFVLEQVSQEETLQE